MFGNKKEVVAANPETPGSTYKTDANVKTLSESDVVKALKATVKSFLGRYKGELEGENQELLDRALRKYRSKVARRSWSVSQKWCKWNDDGPVLMPDQTRLYYRKGNTEVVILEYAPQVRLMKFTGSLAKRANTSVIQEDADKRKVHNYSLALPYIVFIFRFTDGIFSEAYLAFNDRPMKRLQEKPLRPYLSNLDSNLKICFGPTFTAMKDQLVKGDIVQQVDLALNNFWSTIYSDEWSGHYWNTKEHFDAISDNRMATLEGWQQASMDNPLFVVEDVNWLQHTEESFGDMIVRLFENDNEDASYQQDLYNDLVDAFINEVKNLIDENYTTVESKVAVNYEDLATQLLTQLDKLGK